jgi:hypothetical protein
VRKGALNQRLINTQEALRTTLLMGRALRREKTIPSRANTKMERKLVVS